MVVPGPLRGGLRGIRFCGSGTDKEEGDLREFVPAAKTKRGRDFPRPRSFLRSRCEYVFLKRHNLRQLSL